MYRPKAVQIWAANGNPGLSASREGMVDDFDISFNVEPREDGSRATTRVSYPYTGAVEGTYLGPDGINDSNHGVECRRIFGGLDSCSQLSAVNLNAHEPNHDKKNDILEHAQYDGLRPVHVHGDTQK